MNANAGHRGLLGWGGTNPRCMCQTRRLWQRLCWKVVVYSSTVKSEQLLSQN